MGVVNVTPDSFYDGGLYFEPARAIEQALKLIADGADIIDVGGESSRPGAAPGLGQGREETHPAGHRSGAGEKKRSDLGGYDQSRSGRGGHRRRRAHHQRHQRRPVRPGYPVARFEDRRRPRPDAHEGNAPDDAEPGQLRRCRGRGEIVPGRAAGAAREAGVREAGLICDPGIGFAKTLEHNLALINNIPALAGLGRPVLVGISRKSFIGKILDAEPEDRLEGTIAAAVVSALNGAAILRVHDVLEVKRALAVAEAILNQGTVGPGREARRKPYVH